MTNLPPAAQAVLDAYDRNPPCIDLVQCDRNALAAALRAAADQVVPEDDDMPLNLAHRVRWDARQSVRFQLLNIAAELEGAQ